MAYTRFDLLQWMDPQLQHEFLARLQRRSYSPGQFVYVQGSRGTEMYRLVSGTVKISVLRPDGRQITYTLFESGDCFGQTSLVDDQPRPQSTEAATPIEVGVLTKADFRALGHKYPTFHQAITRLLSAQLRVVAQSYEGASLDGLPVRMARKILQTHADAPHQSATGLPQVRLSQSDLASMVGASRQSVNRVLLKLQQQGLIEVGYGSVNIKDLDGLRAACRRDED
ncbi:MAG TPA: hypothetical protein DIC45_02915 [Comamonadaceae bacterium]|uniref:Crp/Fnr family transcriptional regulator n=1 Tax=Pulveribacter sp. TaxID=2678893 RepID=UPI000EE1694E|nr:Crp/Fnr family transcriptional regulator [Pulveribacter sp.]HCL85460.1 hypothetical protein [Comamonadaceae bacterium]